MRKLLCSIKHMPLKHARRLGRGLRFMDSMPFFYRAVKHVARIVLKKDFAIDSDTGASLRVVCLVFFKALFSRPKKDIQYLRQFVMGANPEQRQTILCDL